MPICVLCARDFVEGSEEHILPNAIGWSQATTDIVCPACNTHTAKFDSELIGSVSALITIIDPVGRRNRAPGYEPKGTVLPVTIKAGGEVAMPGTFTFQREGETWVSVDDAQLAEFTARMARKGRAVEFSEHVDRTEIPDAVIEVLDLRLPSLLAMGKAACHFAALHVPDWDRHGSGVAGLRDALIGSADSLPGSGLFAWDFDQPPISDQPFYHGIELIACSEVGSICLRVHVFGLIRVRFVLTDSYRGDTHKFRTVARDPRTGEETVREGRCPHPLPVLYARQRFHEYPTERARRYFAEHRHLIRPEEWVDKLDSTLVRLRLKQQPASVTRITLVERLH